MEARFEKSPFYDPAVTNLLRELSRLDFFSYGLLIGSWPMVVFTQMFTLSYGLTTNDIDFAVIGAMRIPQAPLETIPQLMERLGFSPLNDYSGIETYLQGVFEVEFMTHRRGAGSKGNPAAVVIQPWKVSAQPLPFIDMLFIRPVSVSIEDFHIRIPSPEALMLHKLIIAQRRTGQDKDEKRAKDLQQCLSLVEIARTEEVQQILAEYPMSQQVRRSVSKSCSEVNISVPGGLPW